jgi:hypothetical protein
VLSRTSLSASTLDLDTEGGRPGDCSEVRVDVRWARPSAIAHHNAMVTTKAVTTPHDDTAIRNKMMNSSNGSPSSLDGRMLRPIVDPSPSDLSKRYPTSPATHGSVSGSSQRHIDARSEEFGDPDAPLSLLRAPVARPPPSSEHVARLLDGGDDRADVLIRQTRADPSEYSKPRREPALGDTGSGTIPRRPPQGRGLSLGALMSGVARR